jgi:hypothetical protein
MKGNGRCECRNRYLIIIALSDFYIGGSMA